MLIHDNSVFDAIRKESIERIKILKPIIGNTFEDTDKDKMLEKGSRWRDEDRIFYTACGDVMEHISKTENRNFNNRASEKEALDFMKMSDQQELDQFFIHAMLDAAGSDYWYHYEKEY